MGNHHEVRDGRMAKRLDYSEPPRLEVHKIVAFLRKKFAETGATVEEFANAAEINPKTIRHVLEGIQGGNFRTVEQMCQAMGYELGLRKVGSPMWQDPFWTGRL